jgi:hypothetical protein
MASASNNVRKEATMKSNVNTSLSPLLEERAPITASSHRTHQTLYDRFQSTWLLEHFSLVLAVLLFGAVCVLVAYYNQKPLSTWTADLSFNTVLSILSIPLRGAILVPAASAVGQLKWLNIRGQQKLVVFRAYDEATRGPFGAFKLLTTSGRRPLAVLGAIIILVSLINDAFIQASVSIKLRDIQHLEAAKLPVLHNYAEYSVQRTAQGNNTYVSIQPASVLPGALYASVVNSGSINLRQDVQANCSTGHCEFGAYTTLVVRTTIEDYTSELRLNDTTINDTANVMASLQLSRGADLTLEVNDLIVPYLNTTAVELPPLNTIMRKVQLADIYGMAFNTTAYTSGTFENGTVIPINVDTVRSRFSAFHVQYYLEADTNQATVSNGTLIDYPVYTADTWTYADGGLGNSYAHIPLVAGGNASILDFAYMGLTGLFSSSFNGSGGAFSTNTTRAGPTGTWTNPMLQAVYANGIENLNDTFYGIGSGLSNFLRTTSTQEISGYVLETQSYYQARFGFLVLPAALIVATALLLIVTDIHGRQMKAPLLKSDIIATIVGTRQIVDTRKVPATVPGNVLSLGRLDGWAEDKRVVL